MRKSTAVFFLSFFCSLLSAAFGNAQQTANSNQIYQQLRTVSATGDGFAVSNFDLKRDAATFHFEEGTFQLYAPVHGRVTGAVFRGKGHLHITPPTAIEKHNLSIVQHKEVFDEDFGELVLRFGDETAAELKKAAQPNPTASVLANDKSSKDLREFLRDKLHENYDLRILADVLNPVGGGFFLAAVHGRENSHLLFFYDPQGADSVSPEEVALFNWKSSEGEFTIPLAFHREAEYANQTASGNEHNASYSLRNENLDVTIEKSGFLSALATVELQAQQDGVAVIPMNLYRTLRVSKVENDKGTALDFVQEKKDDDPDFGVILAEPLKKGDIATLKITYGGKDVVQNEGSGNYYPVARMNWFPNSSQMLGDYVNYHMLFHTPKNLQLIATGTKIGEKKEGNFIVTEWKTEQPLAVVGFSLGDFASKSNKISFKGGDLTLDVYANKDLPDAFESLSRANSGLFGSLSTVPLLGQELSEGEAAVQIYSDFFGSLPFSHIELTQQSACNYGQSWPMLVYLPVCGFFDQTQQHFMGLSPEDDYWKVVTSHEVAHQWWGQTVGFRSYRDQWMSEGFADASASIYLQYTRKNINDFRDFWKHAQKRIVEKNAFGFRPIDVGPVTMGVRLSSPQTGWNIYQNLVYPKGAYILHMIRMMMWTPQNGDARFKAMMQDFTSRRKMQAATTEDFKAEVEKYMSQSMDLDKNHKMDWFFNEYVYGTELPVYHFESQLTPNGDGTSVHFKLQQSGTSENFKMIVPVYLEFTDGKVIRMGNLSVFGDKPADETVQLPKTPQPIRRVFINYYYDVLSIEK